MKKFLVLFVVLTIVISATGCLKELGLNGDENGQSSPSIFVAAYFCPDDDCDDVLISEIDKAQETIHVAIYSFTLENVRDALIRAKARGVDVKVLFDEQQASSQYSMYHQLKNLKVDVLLDSNKDYMHNKFAVIDGSVVITGSYNWSQHATSGNDENFVIIRSTVVAEQYEDEFQELWDAGE